MRRRNRHVTWIWGTGLLSCPFKLILEDSNSLLESRDNCALVWQGSFSEGAGGWPRWCWASKRYRFPSTEMGNASTNTEGARVGTIAFLATEVDELCLYNAMKMKSSTWRRFVHSTQLRRRRRRVFFSLTTNLLPWGDSGESMRRGGDEGMRLRVHLLPLK